MTTSVQNVIQRLYNKFNPLFFLIDQKKSLAKEKSPADDKLPEILSQWQQKITTPYSLRSLVRQVIFAFAISQNLLTAIFSHAGKFLTEKIKFYSGPNYAYNKLFIFILESTEI